VERLFAAKFLEDVTAFDRFRRQDERLDDKGMQNPLRGFAFEFAFYLRTNPTNPV
jgi:hypothetical protein